MFKFLIAIILKFFYISRVYFIIKIEQCFIYSLMIILLEYCNIFKQVLLGIVK